MGRCRYCQQSARFFSNEHANCSEGAEAARKTLRSLTRELVRGEVTGEHFSVSSGQIATNGRLSSDDISSAMYAWFDDFVREFALEQPVSDPTLDRILQLYGLLYPAWVTLDAQQKRDLPGYLTLIHSGTLYDVFHGTVPVNRLPGMASGFRLDTDESPIVRRGTILAGHRSARSGSIFQSVSIPIGMGMYYRIGNSQPNFSQSGLTQLDQGLMLLTTKAIYFSGNSSTFRIDYESILRASPCIDGFEVDGNFGAGKVFLPFRIGTIDESWFFYNIVAALTHIG